MKCIKVSDVLQLFTVFSTDQVAFCGVPVVRLRELSVAVSWRLVESVEID